MTAEVAILNAHAVAIAADSAVTASSETREKIFTSANKIFSLGKRPVAVMIYASAAFMQAPWETVLKHFREHLGTTVYPHTVEYAEHLLNFLATDPLVAPAEAQEVHAQEKCGSRLLRVLGDMQDKWKKLAPPISVKDVRRVVGEVIRAVDATNGTHPHASGVEYDRLKTLYEPRARQALKDVFENVPFTRKQADVLVRAAIAAIQDKFLPYTGVVVTGFGKEDLFPSIYEYWIEGACGGKLYWEEQNRIQISRTRSACILPFAQQEMVHLFMNGVDPDYEKQMDKGMRQVLTELPRRVLSACSLDPATTARIDQSIDRDAAMKQYKQQLALFRRDRYVRPVMEVVGMLPKDELAVMAETLVNLTSFKRRMSAEQTETVGGPVDVAVISRGDGLVWIKRKHYFKPELNPTFMSKYGGRS